MKIRSRTPTPPYCWQSKEALRRIREHLDGDSLLPYALSVYCALTENASDKGQEEFTTLQGHLARLSGNISTRTVRRVLPILREIGVLEYVTPRLRGPIIFKLLSVQARYSGGVGTNSPNVRTRKKTGFQAANRSNNEITNEETNEITYSLRAERSESESDSSLAAKADGGEAPHAREKAASEHDVRDAAFAEFWAAYPRKVGKLTAQRAWSKRRPPLSEVLAALEVWRNSGDWRREGGRYIPYPATWLNRGGWEDELPAVRQQPESFI
jgi:hypothetical protein